MRAGPIWIIYDRPIHFTPAALLCEQRAHAKLMQSDLLLLRQIFAPSGSHLYAKSSKLPHFLLPAFLITMIVEFPISPSIKTLFAPGKKHGNSKLAITFSSDTLKAAAESYLGPKYQEGFVLGRQGIR